MVSVVRVVALPAAFVMQLGDDREKGLDFEERSAVELPGLVRTGCHDGRVDRLVDRGGELLDPKLLGG